MSKRAERRFHLQRMKKRAKQIYPKNPNAIKQANHLKSCSCFMCGNCRKKLKGEDRYTRQELRNSDWKDG